MLYIFKSPYFFRNSQQGTILHVFVCYRNLLQPQVFPRLFVVSHSSQCPTSPRNLVVANVWKPLTKYHLIQISISSRTKSSYVGISVMLARKLEFCSPSWWGELPYMGYLGLCGQGRVFIGFSHKYCIDFGIFYHKQGVVFCSLVLNFLEVLLLLFQVINRVRKITDFGHKIIW